MLSLSSTELNIESAPDRLVRQEIHLHGSTTAWFDWRGEEKEEEKEGEKAHAGRGNALLVEGCLG